jgi:hypothetical protein
VIIGGGAVGVQMATDIKELYPEKSVTLVHSRANLMNRFNSALHDIIAERCRELGVQMILGSRVKLPEHGYPTDGRDFTVELEDGSSVPADFAVSFHSLISPSREQSKAHLTPHFRSSAQVKHHNQLFFPPSHPALSITTVSSRPRKHSRSAIQLIPISSPSVTSQIRAHIKLLDREFPTPSPWFIISDENESTRH